ncbi:hypothetical protein PMIN03_005563 [Paraphaeosphaeria minitans]
MTRLMKRKWPTRWRRSAIRARPRSCGQLTEICAEHVQGACHYARVVEQDIYVVLGVRVYFGGAAAHAGLRLDVEVQPAGLDGEIEGCEFGRCSARLGSVPAGEDERGGVIGSDCFGEETPVVRTTLPAMVDAGMCPFGFGYGEMVLEEGSRGQALGTVELVKLSSTTPSSP